MSIFWTIPLVFLILFELIADIFSEKYALHGNWQFWLVATTCYLIGNIFWLWSMRDGSGLARGSIIFAVISTIAAIVIGIYFYHEKVTQLQLIGMGLGLISLIFILT